MQIQQQVDLFNWPFASALAVVLLALALIVFAVFERSLGVAHPSPPAGRH